ncbi:MAG: hypothetical protein HOV68_05355 [Streptomycetaceae bacterium]|nr:hypothetical protein [Streptomycetaceae bacterium]
MTTVHRGSPVTTARHEALRSPLPAEQLALPAPTTWLRERAGQFAAVAERPFHLLFDLAEYTRRTGLPFAAHYVAQVYRGEPDARLGVPLMVINLAHVPTREAADRVFAHELMHLRVPSYGHKKQAFAWAQRALDQLASQPPPGL